MNKSILYISFLLISSFSPTSLAYTLYGTGSTESCGSWLQDEKDGWSSHVYNQNVGWLTGYVSAFSVATGQRYKDTDVSAMLIYMNSYCQKHPLEPFATGARMLVHELFID